MPLQDSGKYLLDLKAPFLLYSFSNAFHSNHFFAFWHSKLYYFKLLTNLRHDSKWAFVTRYYKTVFEGFKIRWQKTLTKWYTYYLLYYTYYYLLYILYYYIILINYFLTPLSADKKRPCVQKSKNLKKNCQNYSRFKSWIF